MSENQQEIKVAVDKDHLASLGRNMAELYRSTMIDLFIKELDFIFKQCGHEFESKPLTNLPDMNEKQRSMYTTSRVVADPKRMQATRDNFLIYKENFPIKEGTLVVTLRTGRGVDVSKTVLKDDGKGHLYLDQRGALAIISGIHYDDGVWFIHWDGLEDRGMITIEREYEYEA